MGKKDKKISNTAPESDNEEEDGEFQAEMAAVMAMRNEQQQQQQQQSSTGEGNENFQRGMNKAGITYNAEGLRKCMKDIDEGLPFLETMIVSGHHLSVQNENDDIEREMAFYNQTLTAVMSGRAQLEELSVPTRRPVDFFCEHVKSDSHMAKIKDRLLIEEKRIEAFELRKNREQNKKFNKQVIDLKKQEKSKHQKQNIEEVNELRRSKGGATEERVQRVINGDPSEKSKKRKAMDKKYGFGGRERKVAKLNDRKSLNDLTDFNPRGGKFVRRSKLGAGGSSGAASAGGKKKFGDKKRPGKDARTKKRSDRKASN